MPHRFHGPDSNRALNVLAATVVVAIIIAGLYWARVIFVPIALAIFFTFILAPVVQFLQRRGLGRVPSVLLVMAATVLTFGAVGLVVGRQVAQLTQTLPDNAEKIKQKVATIKGWVSANEGSRVAELVNDVYDIFTDPHPAPTVVVDSSPSWVARAQGFLSPAAEALGQAAFTFVLLLFMLLKREDLRNRIIRLLGHGRVTTTTKAVDETSRRISRYLLVQFIINAAFGVVITLGLLLMSVQYAPFWGFVAFLMRYVPYIGTWIGAIPPALFTFAVTDGWGMTILVLVLFISLELVCNNVLEPHLYGKSLGLSEVAQLIAAAFWAFLWGPVGLILSGPLTTCLLVLGKYVPEWRFLNVLLGDEPVLSPREAFYQRLMARDQDEAAAIIEKESTSRPPEEVFDDLFVQALAAARRDADAGRLSDDDLSFMTGLVRELADDTVEVKPSEASLAPSESRARALLVPAKDGADLAAVELLARLLDPVLWEGQVAPANTLPSELLERIEAFKPDVVVISSFPPGGLIHTRYLYKRLRQRFPEMKFLVCRWTVTHENESWQRFREAGADEIVASLAEARTFLDGWRAVFATTVAAPKPEDRKGKSKAPIGTTRA